MAPAAALTRNQPILGERQSPTVTIDSASGTMCGGIQSREAVGSVRHMRPREALVDVWMGHRDV